MTSLFFIALRQFSELPPFDFYNLHLLERTDSHRCAATPSTHLTQQGALGIL
jgi:hypothetical protein